MNTTEVDTELEAFAQFMKQRERASVDYTNGNSDTLVPLCALDLPATFFPPSGGMVKGADAVANRYANDARFFKPGGSSRFEVLQMAANDGIGYWTGTMHATAKVGDASEAVPMHLRVTEIFRREGNDWKMVHRHADMLTEDKKR